MNSRTKLVLLVSAAFLIKLLIYLLFVHHVAKWEDNETALNLLHTGEMKYLRDGNWDYAYQFPVYCFMQFAVYKAFGVHDLCIILMQLALSSITAYLLYNIFTFFTRYARLEGKLFTPIPLLATAAYLAHPLITYYTIGHIHPFSMDLLMAMLIIYTGIRYYEAPSGLLLLLLGIVTGIGTLERATLVTALVPVLLLLVRKVSFIKTGIIILVAFLVTLPWLYRNHSITGKWELSSAMGRHLWVGSLQETEGSNVLDDGRNYFHVLSQSQLDNLGKHNAQQQDSIYLSMYLQKVKNDPASIARMFFVKLGNFWWFRSSTGAAYDEGKKAFIPVYKFFYAMILLFAAIAVIKLRKQSLLILSFPLAISLLQSFFYVETRHRFIVEPFMVFLALMGIAFSVLYLQEKKRRS